jgi:hypothetical protein
VNTTAPRPTENAAIGRCKTNPKPRRSIADIGTLLAIAIRNGDRRGQQLFTAMLRRLIGVEVAW